MKKLIILLLSIVMALSLSGCTTTTTAASIEGDSVWGIADSSYEKSTYTLTIVERSYANSDYTNGETIATGTYVQEVQNYLQDGTEYAKINTSLVVDYYDIEEAEENRGLTDTMTSEVVFTRLSNRPVYSTKTADFALRFDDDGEPMANYSYYYYVDYENTESSVYFGKTATDDNTLPSTYDDESLLTISSSAHYDNEQLFLSVRSLSGLDESCYLSLYTYNAIDAYDYQDEYYNTLTVSAEDDMVSVTLDDFILNYTDESKIDCLDVSVTLSGYNYGSVHKFLITDPDIDFSPSDSSSLITKKLIAHYSFTTYETYGYEDLCYTYKLSDYTTEKIADTIS